MVTATRTVAPLGTSLKSLVNGFVLTKQQAGFLSPPFATSIFYLRGAAAPELVIAYGHIIKGVYPFIAIVLVVITLCVFFPQIVLWLPGLMIR